MSGYKLKIIALAIGLLGITFFSSARQVQEPQNKPAEWSKDYEPFRIAGNLYYVGTYDLACYLITTPKGNILINTGLAASAQSIKKNIESLGFKFKDIKILLTTQAHYDHMGAIAAIKKMTGAKFMIDEKDADVAADGGKSDYALGSEISSYEPVEADRLLHDSDLIKLGDAELIMLHHPGHTKGSCSYTFNVNDGSKKYKVLIANLPTIVTDKSFSSIPAYPDVAKDYAYTLSSLKSLQFDIWFASHASQFALHSKHKPGDPYNPSAFIDQKGYDEALNNLQASFDKHMKGN
jgi:metallo-beta-lactamase class B